MAAASDDRNIEPVSISETNSTANAESAFPCKLHIVLDESERQGYQDVICWQGDRTFAVHQPKKFEESIMREYFNQTHYTSFQWQLLAHGFERVESAHAPIESYTHKLFVRGNPNMCRFMIQTEGTKKKKNHDRRSSAPPQINCRHPIRISSTVRRSTSNFAKLPKSIVPGFDRSFHSVDSESCSWEEFRYRKESPKVRKRDTRSSPSSSVITDAPISPVTYAKIFNTDDDDNDSIPEEWLSSHFGGSELADSSLSLNYDETKTKNETEPIRLSRPSDEVLGPEDDHEESQERDRRILRTLDAGLAVMKMATETEP